MTWNTTRAKIAYDEIEENKFLVPLGLLRLFPLLELIQQESYINALQFD